jgi:hypothetical protein
MPSDERLAINMQQVSSASRADLVAGSQYPYTAPSVEKADKRRDTTAH